MQIWIQLGSLIQRRQHGKLLTHLTVQTQCLRRTSISKHNTSDQCGRTFPTPTTPAPANVAKDRAAYIFLCVHFGPQSLDYSLPSAVVTPLATQNSLISRTMVRLALRSRALGCCRHLPTCCPHIVYPEHFKLCSTKVFTELCHRTNAGWVQKGRPDAFTSTRTSYGSSLRSSRLSPSSCAGKRPLLYIRPPLSDE